MIHLHEVPTKISTSAECRKLFSKFLEDGQYQDAVILLIIDNNNKYISLREKERVLKYLTDNDCESDCIDSNDKDNVIDCLRSFLSNVASVSLTGYELHSLFEDEYNLYEYSRSVDAFTAFISSYNDEPMRIRNSDIVVSALDEIAKIEIKNISEMHVNAIMSLVNSIHYSDIKLEEYDNEMFFVNYFIALFFTNIISAHSVSFVDVFNESNVLKHIDSITAKLFAFHGVSDVLTKMEDNVTFGTGVYYEHFLKAAEKISATV